MHIYIYICIYFYITSEAVGVCQGRLKVGSVLFETLDSVTTMLLISNFKMCGPISRVQGSKAGSPQMVAGDKSDF